MTQFTEPAAMMGATVSQANFTYHIKDQASWASNAALQEAFPNLGKAVGSDLTDKAVLVLTNTGWVDSRTVNAPK